ncbi:MAG: MFS transporter [Oscillospiraceae bacterium]|nr:MFS transporter [Oscillospiraceae bacterium]
MAQPALIGQAKEMITDFTVHWSKPAKGNYVPYKETVAFSVGKFGYIWAIALVSQISLVASNKIVAQALGVDPMHVQAMNVLSIIICFFFTMIRSSWVDNSRSKDGRFRPFMKVYGIPTLLLAFAFVWFPFDKLPNGGLTGTGYWMKVGVIFLLHLAIQFVYPLYTLGYDNLIAVMSPNSQERQNIYAVSSVIYSLSWSIYIPIITIISDRLPNRAVDMNLYRWAYIPVCVLGLGLGYFGYFGTRERIIQSREHVNKINIGQTLKAVAKNRNFWVICFSAWAGFLENNSNDLLDWSYNYQQAMSGGTKAFIDLVVNNAALWSMLLTPFLVKRYGKRFILIGANLLNIVLLAVTYNTYKIIPMLALFRFINFFFNIVLETIRPAIDADIRDAQQYMTGERIDGMFGLVRYADTLITMGTGFVTPALWKRCGIFEGNGAKDNYGNSNMWFALADEKTYDRMSKTMILTAVVGAAANVVPMFFYNLTEAKQRAMTRVLKLRAMLEDYGAGNASPEQMAEGIEIIRQAREDEFASELPLTKDMGRKERARQRERNQDIGVAFYVLDELKKFETPEMRLKVALARQVYEAGLEGLYSFAPAPLPEDNKALRGIVKAHNSELRRAAGAIARCYPNHDARETTREQADAVYDLPEATREQARAKTAAIKVLEAERSKFLGSCKPWTDARKLLRELENQANLEDILAQYDDCVAQAAENERLNSEKAQLEREQKRFELEQAKLRRKAEQEARKR